jgi:hypothetical protein
MTARDQLPDAISALVDRVGSMPGVQAVVLGGSQASGAATPESDWDLGAYYRAALDLTALQSLGDVHPPGSWGRLMNGGAWLDIGGVRVDVLLRDLDAVEHWTAEAQHGRFEVDGLLGYLAGIPTYTLTSEVASSIVLRGGLALPTAFPAALAERAPQRWRFARDFSLAHARRAADLGNEPVALGQLARAMIEESHARHCARAEWVLNEKRIFTGTGIRASLQRPDGTPLHTVIEAVGELLSGTG